ncbi:hypothetical protein [Nocardia sp. NPDC057440]|uniref:hypothetical protein n=1 Tax=Nocardia sp. NPDC057440 TaxID=3346134 RepID=UPI0036722176
MSTLVSEAAYLTAVANSSRAVGLKEKFDNALVRYDAWFLVFVAVIVGLGATMLLGMAVWCVVNQHGSFTGNWNYENYGVSVNVECSQD